MPELAAEQSLGFLISDVGRLIRKRFDQRARSLGLTRAQWQVLFHLARQEGVSQAALAELLEIEPITLSRQIDRMEEAGWVRRGFDPLDRRVRLLSMTDKARGVLEEMRSIGRALMADSLQGLEPEAVQVMTAGLQHLRANLSGKPADSHPIPKGAAR